MTNGKELIMAEKRKRYKGNDKKMVHIQGYASLILIKE